MLSLHGKHGVVISRMPVMQNGLGGLMARHFPEFELSYCRSLQELTLLQFAPRGRHYCRYFRRIQEPSGCA